MTEKESLCGELDAAKAEIERLRNELASQTKRAVDAAQGEDCAVRRYTTLENRYERLKAERQEDLEVIRDLALKCVRLEAKAK